jgi:hypothetical protein
LLPALHLRQTVDGGLRVVQDNLQIRAEFAEERAHDAFRLFKHGDEQVLRLDLLMLVALGRFDGRLDGLLPAQCKTF